MEVILPIIHIYVSQIGSSTSEHDASCELKRESNVDPIDENDTNVFIPITVKSENNRLPSSNDEEKDVILCTSESTNRKEQNADCTVIFVDTNAFVPSVCIKKNIWYRTLLFRISVNFLKMNVLEKTHQIFRWYCIIH